MLDPPRGLGQRSETVRRANLSAIVRELHARGPLLALGARRPDRPDPQRDPRAASASCVAADLVTEERAALARHAGPAVAARPA